MRGRRQRQTLRNDDDLRGRRQRNTQDRRLVRRHEFPAGKRTRDSVVAGENIHAVQVWAGPISRLSCPTKRRRDCVKGKLPPDQVTNADIVFITVPSCAAAAPPTAQPITVKVYAELTVLDAETTLVSKRTYLEKTDLPEGTLTLELPPTAQCTVQ